MHVRELLIENPHDQPMEVWCEPWGFSLTVPPGVTFRFVGTGAEPGDFEVVREAEGTTLYAWPTSTSVIYYGEQVVLDLPIPIPPTPPGMSIREFLNIVLGKSD